MQLSYEGPSNDELRGGLTGGLRWLCAGLAAGVLALSLVAPSMGVGDASSRRECRRTPGCAQLTLRVVTHAGPPPSKGR